MAIDDPYVDIAYVKLVSSMPPADIDLVESMYPGVFVQLAKSVSRMFDSKLTKRYNVPFVTTVPESLKWNVALVVGAYLWRKRGFDPGSAQDTLIEKDKDDGLKWLQEAADSKDGLVELPLRAESPNASGILKSRPMSTHDASPYAWTDEQRYEGRLQDCNRVWRY